MGAHAAWRKPPLNVPHSFPQIASGSSVGHIAGAEYCWPPPAQPQSVGTTACPRQLPRWPYYKPVYMVVFLLLYGVGLKSN